MDLAGPDAHVVGPHDVAGHLVPVLIVRRGGAEVAELHPVRASLDDQGGGIETSEPHNLAEVVGPARSDIQERRVAFEVVVQQVEARDESGSAATLSGTSVGQPSAQPYGPAVRGPGC